ncbi:MAG: hypothetical protein L6R38_006951 [Xanthoria sp. 2 TBL-2021]|nr:MAG: hypothetical protein L6R38_006951 [Xanthoria sp. 2 TBL-2021]
MTTPFVESLTRSASKRARSTNNSRSGTPTPVPKALKTQEDQASSVDVSVPAFLRQSAAEIRTKFQDLECRQLLRIAEGRRDPASNWTQDTTKQTKLRNRYLNVQPWDKSRIRLQVPPGESDYINASPITLEDPCTGVVSSYIAAQGPKQTGLSHFWHMIWQQTSDVAVIVMLTQTAESGREKCFQYFPLDEQTEAISIDPVDPAESAPAGSVQSSEVYFDQASRSTIRKMLLTFGDDNKIIWHMLFSGWPDFEVPQNEDRAALFELLRLSAQKNHEPSNPRIIHCSAGVGRSGSFIAMEYLLAQIESGAIADITNDEDPIYDVVNRLREQRMMMVQSDMQYAFLYEVIREQFVKSQHAKQTSGVEELASDIRATLAEESYGGKGTGQINNLADNDHAGHGTEEGKAPLTS